MRKEIILSVTIIGVIGLLCFLSYNIIIKTKEKDVIAKQLQTIPEFELLTLDEKSFSKKNLKQNLNTIFIYFNSECDLCHFEAQNISDNLNLFIEVQFVFVSTEPTGSIQQFLEQYKINNYPNITFLYDKFNAFSRQFDATSVPYILIYNKNQELIKKHKGQLNANGILRALNQND